MRLKPSSPPTSISARTMSCLSTACDASASHLLKPLCMSIEKAVKKRNNRNTTMNYILNQQAAQDEWTIVHLIEGETPESIAIAAGQHIVRLAVWQAQPSLQQRADIGV